MVNANAYVTLLTSDSYIQGVIALAHSLHLTNTQNELVCMVTKDISQEIAQKLEKPGELYDKIIYVDEIDSKDQENLELLGRPELGVTFTKLNVWKLVQYDFVTFLDADTIVLKNIDSLFDQVKKVYNHGDVAFLAAPDVGWPDNFNSGVFVCKPDFQTYTDLVNYSKTTGSFDGGDQGLLNRFFNQWNSTPNARLSFNYNVTPSAYYTYAPAYAEHQDDISVVHFIGNNKPWKSNRSVVEKKGKEYSVHSSSSSPFNHLINIWWNVYDNYSVNSSKSQKEFLKFYEQSFTRSNVSNVPFNHPYDNSWSTKVIQEPNNLSKYSIKPVESKDENEEIKEIEVEVEQVNEKENVEVKKVEEEEKEEDTIRYKWQIHAKIDDNLLPLNNSSNHPTDHAYIENHIETNQLKDNTNTNTNTNNNNNDDEDDDIEVQPRDIDIPEDTKQSQTVQEIVEEVKLEVAPVTTSPNVIPLPQKKEKKNTPSKSSSKKQSNVNSKPRKIEAPVETSSIDDFGSYHISWNFNELRGFRKQYRKYLRETERSYTSMGHDNIDIDVRNVSVLTSEPETEANEDKDDILNISNLPGLHVSEFEEEEEEEEENNDDLHESSVHNKSMTKNENVDIEEFDVYGFNYEDDIKRKSYTNESNEGDISKNGGRRRRRSIIEVMGGFDGLVMTKMPGSSGEEEENAPFDRSMVTEEPLDFTGIIEDNFENDLFINEDEIGNLSFAKIHTHPMINSSDDNENDNDDDNDDDNDEGVNENINRSFVSMNKKKIEKDDVIDEPIPSKEISEAVVANGNDTIIPYDITIEEEVIESIIPKDIIKEAASKNEKKNEEGESETEDTKVPKYNDMIVEVNNVEVHPTTIMNDKKKLISLITIPEDVEIKEIKQDEEKKEKDQTMVNTTLGDSTTEFISDSSVDVELGNSRNEKIRKIDKIIEEISEIEESTDEDKPKESMIVDVSEEDDVSEGEKEAPKDEKNEKDEIVVPVEKSISVPEQKQEIKEEVKEEVKEEIKEEIKEEVKEEIKEEVKEEVKEKGKEEVKEEVKEEIKEEVKEEVKKESKSKIETQQGFEEHVVVTEEKEIVNEKEDDIEEEEEEIIIEDHVIPQEKKENDVKIIRKKIVKRTIRKNGKVISTETKESVFEGNDDDITNKFISSPKESKVVSTTEVIEQEIKNEPSEADKPSEDKKDDNVKQEESSTESKVVSSQKTRFTSIPFLSENDEVLLYTVIVFGKDQDELSKKFETATSDYYLNKITAEEYHTIYVTILNELCKVKGTSDDRYQSLDTPFMKEHSEKLWNSIADGLVKEDTNTKNNKDKTSIQKEEEEEVMKKKRRSLFPFFRRSSKKRHSIISKPKRSKSVGSKVNIEYKKQAMLEARKKYIEDEKKKIAEAIVEEKPEEKVKEEVLEEIKEIPEEEKEDGKQKEEITIKKSSEKPKEDVKKKEKKRWWKKIGHKKDHKKKEKENN